MADKEKDEDKLETEVEENKASMVTKITMRGINTLGKKKFVNSVSVDGNNIKNYIRIKRKGIGGWS